MKRQFLQIGKVRADASEMEAFSFLALHLGFAQGAVCEYSSPFAKRKSIGTSSALFNTHNVAKGVL